MLLEAALEENPAVPAGKLAVVLSSNHTTVHRHLQKLGKVPKIGKSSRFTTACSPLTTRSRTPACLCRSMLQDMGKNKPWGEEIIPMHNFREGSIRSLILAGVSGVVQLLPWGEPRNKYSMCLLLGCVGLCCTGLGCVVLGCVVRSCVVLSSVVLYCGIKSRDTGPIYNDPKIKYLPAREPALTLAPPPPPALALLPALPPASALAPEKAQALLAALLPAMAALLTALSALAALCGGSSDNV
ncbi:hypothetical protein FHG87_022099 [Trinorchestia longiramus]|nr:hypothetical protein FHG87_022099 [Trinorchestia longiramus]